MNIKFPIFFIVFLLSSVQSRNITDELVKLCPFYQQLLDGYNHSVQSYKEIQEMNRLSTKQEAPAEEEKVTYVNEIILMNVERFKNHLLGKVNKSGNGSFGTVIVMKDYTFTKYGDETVWMAGKLTKINNNFLTAVGNQVQRMLTKEITFNKKLNLIDVNNLYFPYFYACVNMTQKLDQTLRSGVVNQENKAYFLRKSNEDSFVLFIEPMSFELFRLVNFLQQGIISIELQWRIKIAVELINGLMIMKQVGYHCDIKPENIMFERIQGDRIREAKDKGYHVLLLQGNYYLVKYIDFGLGELHSQKSLARCNGGTPGYAATDRLITFEHDKLDIYSVGITLLDLELSTYQLSLISDVFAILYVCAKEKKTIFPKKYKTKLENMKLIIEFKKYMDSNQEQFLLYLDLVYPDFRNYFSKTFSGYNIDEVKPSAYFLSDSICLRQMLKASIKLFFTVVIDTLPLPIEHQNNLERISQLESEKGNHEANSTEFNHIEVEIENLTNINSMIENDRGESKSYGNMLYLLIAPYDERPSVEQAQEMITSFFDTYYQKYEETITEIEINDMPIPSEQTDLNSNAINEVIVTDYIRQNFIDLNEVTFDEQVIDRLII